MEPSEKHQVIALEGEIVIQRIGDIKLQIVSALEAGDDLELDLGKVTEMDATGLQLLCSAHRSAQKAGKKFGVAAPVPPVLVSAWKAAGLEREHGCALDRTATCLWKSGEVK